MAVLGAVFEVALGAALGAVLDAVVGVVLGATCAAAWLTNAIKDNDSVKRYSVGLRELKCSRADKSVNKEDLRSKLNSSEPLCLAR